MPASQARHTVSGERTLPLGTVGIIANPAASKDIRRLVAQGRVIPDWEKVNIVRRVMVGLQAVGVREVVAMPDSSHLCERAGEDSHLDLNVNVLDMPAYHTEGDTIRAATLMDQMGVGCIVTLGGDGTNRAVAVGCSRAPIVPISTGTNNVVPQLVEGTQAGLVAGLVAEGRLPSEWVSVVSKTLAVHVDGEYRDMALVDLALSRERYVATRAIWDLSTLYEVFLTRAEPTSIGLSSVGARLLHVSLEDSGGLRYVLGGDENGLEPAGVNLDEGQADNMAHSGGNVMAPIAPGIVTQVEVARWERLKEGERYTLEPRHSTVALDGERAFTVTPQQQVEVSIQRNGPPLVQVEKALQVATEMGLFRI